MLSGSICRCVVCVHTWNKFIFIHEILWTTFKYYFSCCTANSEEESGIMNGSVKCDNTQCLLPSDGGQVENKNTDNSSPIQSPAAIDPATTKSHLLFELAKKHEEKWYFTCLNLPLVDVTKFNTDQINNILYSNNTDRYYNGQVSNVGEQFVNFELYATHSDLYSDDEVKKLLNLGCDPEVAADTRLTHAVEESEATDEELYRTPKKTSKGYQKIENTENIATLNSFETLSMNQTMKMDNTATTSKTTFTDNVKTKSNQRRRQRRVNIKKKPLNFKMYKIELFNGEVIVNRKLHLNFHNWHSIVHTGHKSYCLLCEKITLSNHQHITEVTHQKLMREKVLTTIADYGYSMIHKRPNGEYICSICNIAIAIGQNPAQVINLHVSQPEHMTKLENRKIKAQEIIAKHSKKRINIRSSFNRENNEPTSINIECDEFLVHEVKDYGFVFNSRFGVLPESYHMLVRCDDTHQLICLICEYYVDDGNLERHYKSKAHETAVKKLNFKKEFGYHLIRKVRYNRWKYHCGHCNWIYKKSMINDHLKHSCHIENYEDSQKEASQILKRDHVIRLYHTYTL